MLFLQDFYKFGITALTFVKSETKYSMCPVIKKSEKNVNSWKKASVCLEG